MLYLTVWKITECELYCDNPYLAEFLEWNNPASKICTKMFYSASVQKYCTVNSKCSIFVKSLRINGQMNIFETQIILTPFVRYSLYNEEMKKDNTIM